MHERQARFHGIGQTGQQRLGSCSVAIVGCGAIGSVLAERLARSGVGSLRVIDRDFVEMSNLGSQALYELDDVRSSLPKAVAAKRKLSQIHPGISVKARVADLHPGNAAELLSGVNLILDGTDNLEARYLTNDFCAKHRIPWIYNAAVESYGMNMVFVPGRTPCLRCLYPTPPEPGALPTCETSGVLNGAAAMIASIASAAALKLLVGHEGGVDQSLLLYVDPWEDEWKRWPVRSRRNCPTCQLGEFPALEAEKGAVATALCGRDAVQVRFTDPRELDLARLARRLEELGEVNANEYLIRFRVDGASNEDGSEQEGQMEMVIFADGRAIVKGTSDEGTARSLYAKYIGG